MPFLARSEPYSTVCPNRWPSGIRFASPYCRKSRQSETSPEDHSMPELFGGVRGATEPEFIEMSMHLPAWQIEALANLAERQGLTIGQLLRRWIARLVREGASARTEIATGV